MQSEEIKTCKTCKHWGKYSDTFGWCMSELAGNSASLPNSILKLRRPYPLTGCDFGCVHHKNRED